MRLKLPFKGHGASDLLIERPGSLSLSIIAGVTMLVTLVWALFSSVKVQSVNGWLPYHALMTSMLALALMFLALRGWVKLMLGGERVSSIAEGVPESLTQSSAGPLVCWSGAARPRRVLVADDDAGVRMVMCKNLSNLGVRVAEASDGVEALLSVTDGDWDMVLMDGEMPFMDGIEAIREIRHQHLLPSGTPIVTISANRDQGFQRACLNAGTTACRPKPLDSRDLEALMDEFL